MKLFSVVGLGIVAALAVVSGDDAMNSDIKILQETLAREKRTIGLNENFKKELEINTKSGTSLKLSKSFSFNGGGAVAHLPAPLNSIATKKNHIIGQLHSHHIGGHITAGGQVAGTAGHHASFTGHHGGLKGLIAAKHELLSRKLAILGHHGLAVNAGQGRLKALLAAKHELLMRKLSALIGASANRPIGVACCPTGACCSGNQG